ncbi:MAG: hypothetical protein WBM50_10230 [Acidimicrobiales bacterium]
MHADSTNAEDDKALARQEQIWAGLYGPPGAADLVAKVREARSSDPAGDINAIIRSVEPDDEGDPDEAGTMRPGVG